MTVITKAPMRQEGKSIIGQPWVVAGDLRAHRTDMNPEFIRWRRGDYIQKDSGWCSYSGFIMPGSLPDLWHERRFDIVSESLVNISQRGS